MNISTDEQTRLAHDLSQERPLPLPLCEDCSLGVWCMGCPNPMDCPCTTEEPE